MGRLRPGGVLSEENASAVAFLVLRVKELEDEVARLTERVRYNAEKQKDYRRRPVKAAARSNDVTAPIASVGNETVTNAVTKHTRSGNETVTTLPQEQEVSLPQTPSLQEIHKSKKKYSSPLADFFSAAWPACRPIAEEQESAWKEACPGVDLLAEARSARAWQLEDLQRRQRPKAAQFLGNWFRHAQQTTRAMPSKRNGAALQLSPTLATETSGRKIL